MTGPATGSFLIYNTHSLPVKSGLASAGGNPFWLMFPSRALAASGKSVSGTYLRGSLFWNATTDAPSVTRSILRGPTKLSVVGPSQQPSDPWSAPFLVSDVRRAFYVTTTLRTVRVQDAGYGIDPSYAHHSEDIPPLVLGGLDRFRTEDSPFARIVHGPLVGGGEAGPIERIAATDPNIRTGLGDLKAVRFGDVQLGPQGLIPGLSRRSE